MDKQNKNNFIQLPIHTFKRKAYPIPHFLFQTKLQRSAKNLIQIKKMIESQQYQYVCQISQQRNIFCCKQRTNDRLVVVEVKEISSKNKFLYLSINLTPALKKQIRQYFMLKNWKIIDKICLQDQKGNGIGLLQYNFVQTDLRNFIKKQSQLNKKLKQDTIYPICKDIIQNLCYHHLESNAILDIRPESIVYEQGKWFILNGDYTITNKSTQFGSSMNKPILARPPQCNYMSPIMYQSHVKSDLGGLSHNPYKSDVYSLGLIIWQLANVGLLEPKQISHILQNRKQFYVDPKFINQTIINFRQKYFLAENKIYQTPVFLKMMTHQNQEYRNYIIEICFHLNFTQTLFSKILVPHQTFFKKEVFQIPNSSRKKIQYTHIGIQYEGQVISKYGDQFIKNGRGTITYNNTKIFDGEWKDNLPIGKCNLSFSNLWSYEGYLHNGMLHGQGLLSFNGISIGGNRWYFNLVEQQAQKSQIRNIEKGYYYIVPNKKNQQTNVQGSDLIDYKIYFSDIRSKKAQYIINFFLISDFETLHTLILSGKFIFLQRKIRKLKLFQNVNYIRYNSKPFDLIRIFFSDGQKTAKEENQNYQNAQFDQQNKLDYMDIILGNNIGVFYLITFLKQIKKLSKINDIKEENFEKQKIKKSQVTQNNQIQLDLSGTTVSQDELQEILMQSIEISSLNLSKNKNFLDNSVKYVCNSNYSACFNISSLNLQGLMITDKSLDQLKFSKVLKSLKQLKISHCSKLTDLKIAQFLTQQCISGLQRLCIGGLALNHHGLQKITKNGRLSNLKYLDFGLCNKINQIALIQYLKSGQGKNLQTLISNSTIFKDLFLQNISNEKEINLSNLKILDLSSNVNVTVYGLGKFLLSKNAENIEHLNLSGLDLTDLFIQLIARKNVVNQELKSLNLSNCFKISDKSIKQLLKTHKLLKLQSLNLSKTNISNDTLFLLSQVTQRKLKQINFYKCNKMNDTGFEKFINSQNMVYLQKLFIGGTGIKNLDSLCSQKINFQHLQCLFLDECKQLEQKSLINFLSSKNCSSLQYLNLSSTLISSKCLQAIRQNPFLQSKLLNVKLDNCPNIQQQDLKAICIPNNFKNTIENTFNKQIISTDIKQLRYNPLLLKMTELEITKSHLNMECLFQSDYLINLNKISFKWLQDTIEDDSISKSLEKMSKNLGFNHFKSFSLLGCKFSQKNLIQLLKSSTVKNLEFLDLSWTDLSNETLLTLSNCQFLNSLRHLNLSKCIKFNDKGLIKFIMSSKFALVATLDIRSTLITNSTLQALSTSKYSKSLSKLVVRSCPNINDQGFKNFFNLTNSSALRELDIGWTRITGQIFSYMSKSKNLQISKLKISGLKGIEFQLSKFLCTLSSSTINVLDLNYSEIGYKTINSIISSRYLQSLEELSLFGYQIKEQKLQMFKKMLQCQNLNKLITLKICFCKGFLKDVVKQKNEDKVFELMQKNLLILQNLCLLGFPQQIVRKGKALLKKCHITNEQSMNRQN